MHHIQPLSRSPQSAQTVPASTKVEFMAEVLTAWEPILEAKETTTTT